MAGRTHADADDTSDVLSRTRDVSLVTYVGEVGVTATVGAAGNTSHEGCTGDGARAVDDEVANVSTVADDAEEADIVFVRKVDNEVLNAMFLTVKLTLELSRGIADRRPFNTAHVNVIRQLGIDGAFATVDLAGKPDELFSRADDVVVIDQRAEVVVAGTADDTDTVLELVVITLQFTFGVAVLDAVLRSTVTGEFANGIDLLMSGVEGGIIVLAEVLEPTVGTQIAVEVIGECTALEPFRREVSQRVDILLHVLLVEVEGVGVVAVANAASEALVAVGTVDGTGVPAADHLACAGEPAREDTVLVTAGHVTCVVTVTDDDCQTAAGVVTADEG